jgi:NAD(P)-dependent dehydrogenase (short-subunit alcohol dehydrogenase family)
MKNLSSRLAPYNISVNDVSPAMVGSTGLLPSADSVPGLVDNIPLHRLCAPEEVCQSSFGPFLIIIHANSRLPGCERCLHVCKNWIRYCK